MRTNTISQIDSHVLWCGQKKITCSKGTAPCSDHSIIQQMLTNPTVRYYANAKHICSDAPLVQQYTHWSLSPVAVSFYFIHLCCSLFSVDCHIWCSLSFCLSYFIPLESIFILSFSPMFKGRKKMTRIGCNTPDGVQTPPQGLPWVWVWARHGQVRVRNFNSSAAKPCLTNSEPWRGTRVTKHDSDVEWGSDWWVYCRTNWLSDQWDVGAVVHVGPMGCRSSSACRMIEWLE